MKRKELKELIDSSNNILFFGGAGISTESLIPDFRSDTGLYNGSNNIKYSPEEMLSHTFFIDHTEDFFKFYKEKMLYPNAKPNVAHYSLAKLEKAGKLKTVITQNIDGLHQIAGNENVFELHGSVHRNYCIKCRKTFDLSYVLNSKEIVPRCDECNGIVRPDVVLYEEPLDNNVMKKSIESISKAEIVIVGGTSLVVYPAAGLIRYFHGKSLILINKSPTQYDNMADIVINDSIGKVLSEVI